MEREAERVDLRIVFEGELARRFLEIKRRLGLEANTEVVRSLVNQAYKKLKRGEEA
jgi:hypothetical protein